MKIDVHDMIQLHTLMADSFLEPLPVWAWESLAKAPFVVVRRGLPFVSKGVAHVPVGIRGVSRSQRFAAFLQPEYIKRIISVEQIVVDKMWMNSQLREALWDHTSQKIDESCFPWRIALDALDKALLPWQSRLAWGPTGSVGFELTSGIKTTTPQSDLDLLFKPVLPFSPNEAVRLVKQIQAVQDQVGIHSIDAILKMEAGWVSLTEYVESESSYLVKMHTGEALGWKRTKP